MKTNPTQHPVPTSFPTCGEVFEFLVKALDLTTWSDLSSTSNKQDKCRAKVVSDQLRDWACEPDDRVPSRKGFSSFLKRHTPNKAHHDKLQLILEWLFKRVLNEHNETIRENVTFLNREGTRAWYGRGKAPDAIYTLYQLRKLLSHLNDVRGPMLDRPLDQLLKIMWRADGPKHPMVEVCFVYYRPTTLAFTEADVAAWKAGTIRPQFRSLAGFFRGHDRLAEIMLNFGLAHLIEALAEALDFCVPERERYEATTLLTQQAGCLARLDQRLTGELTDSARYSLADYIRYLDQRVAEFRAEVVQVVNQGDTALLDLRWSDLRCHRDYFEHFSRAVPPRDFVVFLGELMPLWESTRLSEPPNVEQQWMATLSTLRNNFATWSEPMSGVVCAIEARLALMCDLTPTNDSLLAAFESYRNAVTLSRYRGGSYTRQIIKEALGLAALLQRGKAAEGARLLDWIKNTLAWWDLVGFGNDFDHEQDAQRIEKVARVFIDGLHYELRQRWRGALDLPALDHSYTCGGLFGMIEPEARARLKEPLDKRQTRPVLSAATGRDQSPLMEAIDRRELIRALELVVSGADLNFINSTGDSCITKAFACDDYDLMLAILRRDEKPISRSVLTRETDKNRHCVLELALSHGRVDVLREISRWKRDRGGEINLNVERIMGGQTALYYAVMLLATHRMSPEAYVKYAVSLNPDSRAGEFTCDILRQSPEISELMIELKKQTVEKGYPSGLGMGRPDLAMDVITYLIDEADVDIDSTCTNGHTAFTLSVENRMQDVALKLLTAGANVNHRCDSGAAALCFAIINDDHEMVKLLIEHRADIRIRVECIGRPIYAMEMSERIRALIPYRG